MQLAYQVPMLRIVASNANWQCDPFRVPVGSTIRIMAVVTAIVGAPAGTAPLYGSTTAGDFFWLTSCACAAVGGSTAIVENCPEFISVGLTQAGGANSLTMSLDIIVQPPDSTPA